MYVSKFSKHWDPKKGFSMEEAIEKKSAVDDTHGVGTSNAKWNPAEIVPDTGKPNGGYIVIIRAKE